MPKALNSGKITVIIICVVALSITALNWRNRMLEARVVPSVLNAKQIVFACRAYAADHGGNLPPSLDALLPTYLPSRAALASPLRPMEPIGYLYHPGLTTNSPSSTVLLEDKFAPEVLHSPIVIRMDDSVNEVSGTASRY